MRRIVYVFDIDENLIFSGTTSQCRDKFGILVSTIGSAIRKKSLTFNKYYFSEKKIFQKNVSKSELKAVYKNCEACNKEYRVNGYRATTSRFCSKECQNKGQYKYHEIHCVNCKKSFSVVNSEKNRKFCCVECRLEHEKIEKTAKEIRAKQKSYQRALRGNNSSKNVRKIAFFHKKKRCEICGYDEYDFCLDVHHLDENPDNNKIENLIVLCAFCHRKWHKGIVGENDLNKLIAV